MKAKTSLGYGEKTLVERLAQRNGYRDGIWGAALAQSNYASQAAKGLLLPWLLGAVPDAS
ncbi:hypothetical protein ACVI1I_006291 [Bradyrhizobium sp. USDA 4459]